MCVSSALAVRTIVQNAVQPQASAVALRRVGNSIARHTSAHRMPSNPPKEFVKMSPRLVSRPGITSCTVSTVIVVTNPIANARRRDIPASRSPIPNGMKRMTLRTASSIACSPHSRQRLGGVFVAEYCGVSVSTAMNRNPAIQSARPNDLCGINATDRGVRFENSCVKCHAEMREDSGCYNIERLRDGCRRWHPNCKTSSRECRHSPFAQVGAPYEPAGQLRH